MYKLLKAGFYRLRKDKIFWIFIVITIALSIFALMRYSANGLKLENLFNEFIYYEGLFISLFISLFIGREHSEGIIRNKIIVGHKRINIYLSNNIISIVTCLFFQLIYYIIIFAIGTPLYGEIQMNYSDIIQTILDTTLVIISYCSIFNLVTMMFSEITVSTIIGVIVYIIMFVTALNLQYIAYAQKYITNTYWENEEETIVNQELNSNYPGDDVVKLAKNVYYFIPQGQSFELAFGNTDNLNAYPKYSITLIIIVNVIGVYLFKSKELK